MVAVAVLCRQVQKLVCFLLVIFLVYISIDSGRRNLVVFNSIDFSYASRVLDGLGANT